MSILAASCVSIAGQGVLLLGPSGSGKSDLTLRLLDRGADFIADDQVTIRNEKNALRASYVPALKGLLEVRGIGIIHVEKLLTEISVNLVVELLPSSEVERLPHPRFKLLEGVSLPLISLHAFEISAPLKLERALELQRSGNMHVGAFVA